MSKKIFLILIGLILILNTGYLLIRYNQNSIPQNYSNKNNDKFIIPGTNEDSKILVVFFSRAGENYAVGNIEVGNTEIMAGYIKDYTGADSYKIEPMISYSESYEDAKNEVDIERDSKDLPGIANKIDNIDKYDVIFIGYPIWYDDMPLLIYAFLADYDFSGKIVIPFNTHEGSGSAGTYEKIRKKLTTASVLDGLAIRGQDIRSSKDKVTTWLKSLNY